MKEEEIVEIGGMEFIPLDEDLLEEKSWMCSGYTHIQLNGQRMRPSSPPNFGGGKDELRIDWRVLVLVCGYLGFH